MAIGISGKSEIDRFVVARVLKMRNHRRMSQAMLGLRLDLSAAFIGDIENPKKPAKYNLIHINELAKIFECSPKDFLPETPL